MLTQRNVSIFRSWINPAISLLFVGSFALGAGLLIWHAAFGENPIANAMAKTIIEHTTLEDN
ncbi:MAG TPA: hypothetical protein VG984_00390 [Candidatus Paceibacterota bacterium]|nr:hypothetical protein [Candidatus Paceibacterota bacterium]